MQAEGGASVLALRRLVVDADLAKADPAGEALEEAVGLRQLPQRRGGARREQAEIAGVLGNFRPRAPVEQRIERLDTEPARERLVSAMRPGGGDTVVAAVAP